MPKAEHLDSGSWRCRVYSHTENGKRKYVSFIEASKYEAEAKAAAFSRKKVRGNKAVAMTVEQAVEGYLAAKRDALSPSTRRTYARNIKNHYGPLLDLKINKLSNEDIQYFINDLSKGKGLSKKTVENIYKQLLASLRFYDKDIDFNITEPEKSGQGRIKNAKTKQAPSNKDVVRLLSMASPWLKAVIALAAFGSLRRSEIAALKYGDIEGNTICVHSHMVQDEDDKWVWEDRNKEEASFRYVDFPPQVIELLRTLGNGAPDEFIIKYNPNTISKMYNKLRSRAGISPYIRLHDMRHYYASIGAVLHIPNNYLSEFGGWSKKSPIMEQVYQGTIKDIKEGYQKRMTNYFDDVMSNV